LDNIVAVDAALELAKQQGTMRLTELFLGDDDLFARSREGRFVHELAIPLLRTNPALAHPQPRSRTIGQGRRTFAPGSEWLYAKLYAGELAADAILEHAAAVARNAIATGAADRWFFVRYADPDWHLRLRIHGDSQRLADGPLRELFSLSQSALSDKRLWRFQLDTYEREVERYGGYLGIEMAEKLFWADSEAANDVVQLGRRTSGQPRWLFAVAGVDRLLGDFGMNTSANLAIVRAARNQLAGILTFDKAFNHEVGRRYREVRQSVDSILDHDGGIASETGAVEIFARRSQLVKPTACELTALSKCRQLMGSLDSFARCHIHMHVNRVLQRPTREIEFIIYDFLARSYVSRLARTAVRTTDWVSRLSDEA
jgi:thiopeptide-type bacteriocin biosynthesis protein